jgi:hypothetical protein
MNTFKGMLFIYKNKLFWYSAVTNMTTSIESLASTHRQSLEGNMPIPYAAQMSETYLLHEEYLSFKNGTECTKPLPGIMIIYAQ